MNDHFTYLNNQINSLIKRVKEIEQERDLIYDLLQTCPDLRADVVKGITSYRTLCIEPTKYGVWGCCDAEKLHVWVEVFDPSIKDGVRIKLYAGEPIHYKTIHGKTPLLVVVDALKSRNAPPKLIKEIVDKLYEVDYNPSTT